MQVLRKYKKSNIYKGLPQRSEGTNAIESLNSSYRRLNKQRSVFPNDTSLLKALYLSTEQITKKWSMPLRNWGQVYGELMIMYQDRMN
ncbi:MAG TPA: transposase [Gallicola sp.]|nr:transposase [Gallicola sp.]